MTIEMRSAYRILIRVPVVRVTRMSKLTDSSKQHPLEVALHCTNHTSIHSFANKPTSQKSSIDQSPAASHAKLSDNPDTAYQPPCLELILGPMFSGKTTELMRKIEIAEQAGVKVLAVKSVLDTRYAEPNEHESVIVTHNGGKKECYALSNLSSLEKLFPEAYKEAEVIAIDEAQFFADLVFFCTKAVDRDGKKVYAAGLDGDFRRKPFKMNPKKPSPMMQLIPLADKVHKHLSQCHYCKSPAPFTLRTIPDKAEVLVDGGDSYVPVCRRHYLLKWKEIHSDHT